jgi:U3 small nucleolar RNA-associated protein 20
MTSFSTVWETLRKRTQSKRGGRRKGLDDLAVQDPQAYAKRKEKRGEMKRDNKKRKNKSYA